MRSRDPNAVFRVLKDYSWWFEESDLRVGQFFDNFRLWLDDNGKDLFYVEDDELVGLIKEYITFLNEWAGWHQKN